MEILKYMNAAIDQNKKFVLVTVVDTTGSVPGKSGFKMIVNSERTTYGTIGGGAIEKEAINQSAELLQTKKNKLQKYLLYEERIIKNINPDEKLIPMMCSGTQTLFYEVFASKQDIYIFGAGHVGKALIYFLRPFNFNITLIDNREEYSSFNKDISDAKFIFSDYGKYSSEFEPGEDSMIIILTHGHKFDYEILSTLFRRNLKLKYIGAIASKTKAKIMKEELKKEFGEQINLDILHSPIGLKIGGNSHNEIALSIAAEIQSIIYS